MKAKKYLLFFLLGLLYLCCHRSHLPGVTASALMGIAGGLSLAGIGMLETPGCAAFRWRFR